MNPIPECCYSKAKSMFKADFPDHSIIPDGNELINHLRNSDWGNIANYIIDGSVILQLDDPDFVGAIVEPIHCTKNHTDRFLSVIGVRLYYFIWRTNMLLIDNLVPNEHKSFILKSYDDLPQENHIKQFNHAIDMYYNISELSSEGLPELNEIIFEDGKLIPSLVYTWITQIAELFIIFHEAMHIFTEFKNYAGKLTFEKFPTSEKRSERWKEEIQADCDATKILCLSIFEKIKREYNLLTPQAKKLAWTLVFAGSNSALSSIYILERIRFGEVTMEEAGADLNFAKHPTSSLRINSQFQWCKSFTINDPDLGKEIWTQIYNDISTLFLLREKLISYYFNQKPI